MHGCASLLQYCTLLPPNMSVIETFQRYKLQLGQWWFAAKRSGTSATFPQWYIVIYKPGKKQTFPMPTILNQCFWVPMVHIFPVSKLQFSPAASFVCGVWKRMKAFFLPLSRSAARRNGLCGSVVSELDRTICPSLHLPLLSLWLSDHSFAVISPFCSDAKTEAIFEAAVGFHQRRSWMSKKLKWKRKGQERQNHQKKWRLEINRRV